MSASNQSQAQALDRSNIADQELKRRYHDIAAARLQHKLPGNKRLTDEEAAECFQEALAALGYPAGNDNTKPDEMSTVAVLPTAKATDNVVLFPAAKTLNDILMNLERDIPPETKPNGPPQTDNEPTSVGAQPPQFDHAMALKFYNAVKPNGLVVSYRDGRPVADAAQFANIAAEADRRNEHLFFAVATLKPEWSNPKTHDAGKVTTPSKDTAVNMPDGSKNHVLECPYLPLDCDAEKYVGNDPVAAAQHYEREGQRIKAVLDTRFPELGITPFALWRSGAGWQGLVKLERPMAAEEFEEFETLVGKMHTALGFDGVIRNCNRILRNPSSVNWKKGKNGRVPSPCNALTITGAISKIEDVRKALADFVEPAKTYKTDDQAQIKIDWTKVKNPGWLKSAADLPDGTTPKIRAIVSFTGKTLEGLSDHLTKAGITHKPYKSWSDVTFALAAAFKRQDRYSAEEIAEALMAKLPCNHHINKTADDPQRAVERAIDRSYESKQATGPCEPTIEVPPPEKRQPLLPGIYNAQTALDMLNSHYMVGRSLMENETLIYRITDKNRLMPIPKDQFVLEIENISIQPPTGEPIPAHKFWRSHPKRHERNLVFKPHGTDDPREYNLWRGFGVQRRPGRQKIERLLRHIFEVICCSDQAKYDYLMKWHAWAVQHPDQKSETYIVLISRAQGAGKSLLGEIMVAIFGEHGKIITDREHLVGRFNSELEHVVYVLCEEILWAGDHRTTDKLKAAITASTFRIERKFGQSADIWNKLHPFFTSNHEHAVAAGVKDRRTVAYEVSEEHVGDKAWFGPIFADLKDGGYGEFLDLLLCMDLGDWHPREQLKTAELAKQQRMTGDSISQWAQACVEADQLVGERRIYLGHRMESEDLRQSHAWYCKQHNLRPANSEVFGGACAAMFGRRQRLPARTATEFVEKLGTGDTAVLQMNHRPWGYDVPTGEDWQKKIDERLGIQK